MMEQEQIFVSLLKLSDAKIDSNQLSFLIREFCKRDISYEIGIQARLLLKQGGNDSIEKSHSVQPGNRGDTIEDLTVKRSKTLTAMGADGRDSDITTGFSVLAKALMALRDTVGVKIFDALRKSKWLLLLSLLIVTSMLVWHFSAKSMPVLVTRFDMVSIPAGSFVMGARNGNDQEKPLHAVTVEAFALGRTEVTWSQWRGCEKAGACEVLDRPSWLNTAKAASYHQHPVVGVSWDQVKKYIAWLNISSGKIYRLPTESEWEYAARARTQTNYSFGDLKKDLCNYANGAGAETRYPWNNKECADGYQHTAPVAQFRPNEFGLYDMHGNVYEWVQDCWNPDYAGAPINGGAWKQGDCNQRITRGGGWINGPEFLRSFNRNNNSRLEQAPDVGFRLASTP